MPSRDDRFHQLAKHSKFVILGDQNGDPFDGDGVPGAANQLTGNSLINTTLIPSSTGGAEDGTSEGGPNLTHTGSHAHDTADFFSTGNLRADYVLPSANLILNDANVFWPDTSDPLRNLVGDGAAVSDHRLVYVDLTVPTLGTGTGTAVPEPSTLIYVALLILSSFGVFLLRIRG